MQKHGLALAVILLGACSGIKDLNDPMLRGELDQVKSEMRRPAAEFSITGPNLSTRGNLDLRTETDSYTIYVSGKKGTSPRVAIFLGRDSMLRSSGNMITIEQDGTCKQVHKGNCAWLTRDEWLGMHRSAVEFANRHFKDKNFFIPA